MKEGLRDSAGLRGEDERSRLFVPVGVEDPSAEENDPFVALRVRPGLSISVSMGASEPVGKSGI